MVVFARAVARGMLRLVGGLGQVVVLVEVVDDRWESPVKVTATEGVMT